MTTVDHEFCGRPQHCGRNQDCHCRSSELCEEVQGDHTPQQIITELNYQWVPMWHRQWLNTQVAPGPPGCQHSQPLHRVINGDTDKNETAPREATHGYIQPHVGSINNQHLALGAAMSLSTGITSGQLVLNVSTRARNCKSSKPSTVNNSVAARISRTGQSSPGRSITPPDVVSLME